MFEWTDHLKRLYTFRIYLLVKSMFIFFYLFRYFSSKCEVLTNSAGLICPTCKQIKKAYKKKAERCKEQPFVNAKTNHRYMTHEQLFSKVVIVIDPIPNWLPLNCSFFVFHFFTIIFFFLKNKVSKANLNI